MAAPDQQRQFRKYTVALIVVILFVALTPLLLPTQASASVQDLFSNLFSSAEKTSIYSESRFSPLTTLVLVMFSLGMLLYGVLLVTAESIAKRIRKREEERASEDDRDVITSLGRRVTNITRIFF